MTISKNVVVFNETSEKEISVLDMLWTFQIEFRFDKDLLRSAKRT